MTFFDDDDDELSIPMSCFKNVYLINRVIIILNKTQCEKVITFFDDDDDDDELPISITNELFQKCLSSYILNKKFLKK